MSTESTNGNRAPTISVAICTRDRPEKLRRALESLLRQTAAPAEIVVVDNAPGSDATRRLIAAEFPEVRYVREPVAGLDFARNRALREAKHEIVAFLDDDAVAEAAWVGATAAAFRESDGISVVTGRVQALALESPGERLFEANGGFARGLRRIHLPRDAGRLMKVAPVPLIAWSLGIGSGCSMAVKRSAVLRLGGFDPALDLGPELPGGGDLDIFWRVLDAGQEIVYDPLVVARHEHRRDYAAAARQITEHNRSAVAFLTKALAEAKGARKLSITAFLLWRLAKPGFRLARRAVGRDPLPAPLLLRLWLATVRGVFAYPYAARSARLRAESG